MEFFVVYCGASLWVLCVVTKSSGFVFSFTFEYIFYLSLLIFACFVWVMVELNRIWYFLELSKIIRTKYVAEAATDIVVALEL